MAKSANKTKSATWDLTPLFKSDQDPQIAKNLERTEQAVLKFVTKWQKRSDYLTSSQTLLEVLEDYDYLNRHFGVSGKVGYYFRLRSSQNENDPHLKAQENKIDEFSNKLVNKIQFFELNLGKTAKNEQQRFLQDNQLLAYKHFLSKIFQRSKYQLSDAEEKIVNLKSTPAHSYWTRMTSSLLAKEVKRGKNLSQLISDFQNIDKKVRDLAWADINTILLAHADMAENEFNAILSNKKIDDELRGFVRPDQSRHISDDIDSSVVDAMTNAVTKRFDIAQRFYKLRTKILNVPKLKYYERMVPYGKISQKYTYSEAVEIISKVFLQIDPQFAEILANFIKNGQIDVFPKVGKTGGAFCAQELITLPGYILLNYANNLTDVLTFAHEMGHGINNELMKSQPKALNYGSSLAVAEVASTFMEDFVLQDLLKKASSTQRLALYIRKLDDDIATIFRQVAAYNFEKDIHNQFRKEGYLAKEKIGQIFVKHMASYMGPAVEQTKGSENFWVYWSHFRNFFYVYSYASGQLISKSLQAKIKSNPKFITNVKQILSAAAAASPRDIFKTHAQIDIADPKFWLMGLEEIESVLVETEKLYNSMQKGKKR